MMDQTQMLAAIIQALQTPDSNGNFTNVALVIQYVLGLQLQTATQDQLQAICQVLNINTGN